MPAKPKAAMPRSDARQRAGLMAVVVGNKPVPEERKILW
jgi:hypothetical protein